MIASGCCQVVVDVHYRLVPGQEAVVGGVRTLPVVVTSVTAGTVRVGQRGTLTLQGGQVYSSLTGSSNYCPPNIGGACGA